MERIIQRDNGVPFRDMGRESRNIWEEESFILESQGNNKSVGKVEEMRQELRRMELPKFDGNDPIGWLSNAEK